MVTEKIADRVVKTDVLVIGGGLSGCTAACKAAEHLLDVALVEKSKLERSGKAGQGLDEIAPFARDGFTALEAARKSPRIDDPNLIYRIIANSLWALEELERLGINMRYVDGEYGWKPLQGINAGGEVGPKVELRVHWQNVKPEMAAAVRKRGVKVFDRTMIVDLLTNKGKVVGATAVNTRTGEFIVFEAKAMVIATGDFSRHYEPTPPPCWKYKMAYNGVPASSSGDGHAIAYRAGVELTRMEKMVLPGIRDILLMQPGQFAHNDGMAWKEFTWKGEELPGSRGPLDSLEYQRKGLIPLFRSIEHLPDDFQKRVEVNIADESMLRLKLSEDRGFNPRTHRYSRPGAHGSHHMSGSILIDENFKASLKGVYAIGDCAGAGGGAGACISGLLIGDSIHKYVSKAGEPVLDEAQVENQKRAVLAPLAVKDGVEPLELECTIRSLCEEYAGALKCEGMLREGLKRLGSLRRGFLPKLMAVNPHYLMRCLEVRNILDMAELHLQASLERKETRAAAASRNVYVRLDYPERDPSLDNKRLCQRLEKGKAIIEMKEVPVLKPEYAKEKK